MNMPQFPLPDISSLWRQTAIQAPALAALNGSRQCDVAIIGAGYTGLSTARYVAARGLEPVVVDANRVGWGASGRNGGVVEGKFRLPYSVIASRSSVEVARRMYNLGVEAVDHLGSLVHDFGLESADYHATGTVRCAHNQRAFDAIVREVEWLRHHMDDQAYRILSAREIADETRSKGFVGGVLNRHGGMVHPLNLALGIASRLRADGMAIYECSPALTLHRENTGISIETPNGTVRARQLVIATDSYSDLTPATGQVSKTIIPFRSAMIATQPLTGTAGERLMSMNRSYSETRRMMRWFRPYKDRLLYGGRGAFGKMDSESAFVSLQVAMCKQFPELVDIEVSHKWSGLVALTLDAIPHIGRLDKHIVYAMGYNGSGVALANLMGKYAAALVVGEKPALGLLTETPLKPVPLYPLREPVVRLTAGYYQFLDKVGL